MSRQNDDASVIRDDEVAIERMVIGAVVNGCYVDTVGKVKPDDFAILSHRYAYEAAQRLFAENKPIDIVTLYHEIQGVPHDEILLNALRQCALETETLLNVGIYAELVARIAVTRRLLVLAGELATLANDTSIPLPEKRIQTIEKVNMWLNAYDDNTVVDQRMAVLEYGELIDAIIDGAKPETIKTGIADLDRYIGGGFRRSQSWCFAGYTKMNKSGLLLHFATQAAIQGYKVLYFSLEMKVSELIPRQVAMVTRLSNTDQESRAAENAGKIHRALGKIGDYPMRYPKQRNIDAICAEVRKQHLQGGVDVVVVDYIQLVQGPGENQERRITNAIDSLKALAMELDIVVLTASQVNKEGDTFGAQNIRFGTDGTVKLELGKDKAGNTLEKWQKGKRHLIIEDQRNGPSGVTVDVFCDPPTMFWADLDRAPLDLGLRT